jgi:helicase
MDIKELTDSPAINLVLDTLEKNKQALVFCNTRKTAESTAEKIADEIKGKNNELELLSEKILKVLSTPTKQCKRLAYCIKKGIAFHHAGLVSEQRQIVEDSFRKGIIKIICATPTLSFGLNLPAFRSIIKDLKRYGGRWGMEYIPTLEYHQMCLPYEELIATEKGYIPVGELVEKRMKCKVLSLNFKKGSLEYKKIREYYTNTSI